MGLMFCQEMGLGIGNLEASVMAETRKRKTKVRRLSERIAAQFSEEFGIQISDIRLYPNQGFWRSRGIDCDVQPWQGDAMIKEEGWTNWMRVNVCSDYTMTALLKAGFTMTFSRMEIELNIVIGLDAGREV
jgi:hypothetical protein